MTESQAGNGSVTPIIHKHPEPHHDISVGHHRNVTQLVATGAAYHTQKLERLVVRIHSKVGNAPECLQGNTQLKLLSLEGVEDESERSVIWQGLRTEPRAQ